jgi:hypothetical protein
MKKKVISCLIAFMICMTFTINVHNVYAEEPSWDTSRYGDLIDIGPKLRQKEKDNKYMDGILTKIKQFASRMDLNDIKSLDLRNDKFTTNGGTKYFLAFDEYDGYYLKTYTLRSIGDNVEVWIADNLEYLDDRETPVITQEQADHMRDVFDEKVYPTDTNFFGMHDSHTGPNATLPSAVGLPSDYYVSADGIERIIILVDNFRDTSFYDPNYPLMIGGFYSSAYEKYTDRNIISITARSWEKRLDSNWLPTSAHEFQHLIHDDNDSSEETWLNEGMSDFAEFLCFGIHPTSHVNGFLDYPENSLVEWDEHVNAPTGPETLADYGQAYLFQLYLNDHFGKDFIQSLAVNKKHGIESVNEVLQNFNTGIDFEELFKRFTLAATLDNEYIANGIYSFENIDVSIDYESALIHDKNGVPAWGGDYKILDNSEGIQKIKLNGIEYMPIPWKVIEDPKENKGQVFWGNNGNLIDNQLIFNADLTNAQNPKLKFDTYVDIEPKWDAGMVQVSTDNGETWTSLANDNTIDKDEFPLNEQAPKIYNNLPGLSRNDSTWVTEEFDLTSYTGQQVLIAFRYMTDAAYNDSGWFIDNIEIPEIGYSNDCSSFEGFYGIDVIKDIKVKYGITLINKRVLGNMDNNISENSIDKIDNMLKDIINTDEKEELKNILNEADIESYNVNLSSDIDRDLSLTTYTILNFDPFDITERDVIRLYGFLNGGTTNMITWYVAPIGKKGTVDFTYEIVPCVLLK